MTTRARVLAGLMESGTAGVSGQQLADALLISRTAVAKHIAALQAEGYVIEAARGKGYRLLAGPTESTPAGVRPLVTSAFWLKIVGGFETESTNDDARQLAREGAKEGTAVVAASQTAGRGRLGRSWTSPEGGSYVSVVLRPPISAVEVSTLPLALGIGVARAFERLGASPRLKWPNDVQLRGGKVAGILVEMAAEADRIDWVVAGIGANVRRSERSDEPRAAYLSDEAPSVTPAAAAAAVLDGVAEAYEHWLSGGFASMADEYQRRHTLTGQEVVVRDAMGRVCGAGAVVGVDHDGRLLLDDGTGTPTGVSAGEVTLREP